MLYNTTTPHSEETDSLVEWRGRITRSQKEKLQQLEIELNIPQAALVRLALKTFFPKTENNGFKKEGIKTVWNDTKF